MSDDQTYEKRLATLKRIHARSSQDARQTLEKWGDELARLEMEKDWLAHPNTIQLRNTLASQMERIVSVLANDPNLTEEDRRAHFKAKEIIFSLLAVVSRDPEGEAEAIRRSIDEELDGERV